MYMRIIKKIIIVYKYIVNVNKSQFLSLRFLFEMNKLCEIFSS